MSLMRFDARYIVSGYSAETCYIGYSESLSNRCLSLPIRVQVALQVRANFAAARQSRAVDGVGGLSLPSQGHSVTERHVLRQK